MIKRKGQVWIPGCLWLAVLWSVMGLWTARAQGHGLVAASDGTRLWVLMPQPDRPGVFVLLHYGPGDPPDQLSKVQTLRGEVRPQGVAAREGVLWILYSDGSAQTFLAEPSPMDNSWRYIKRVAPSLPSGVRLRAMAVTDTGPWVLVRVEDRQVLEMIDAQPKPSSGTGGSTSRLRDLAVGLPLGYTTPGAQDVDGDRETQQQDKPPDPQAGPPVSLPVDRLLHLEQGRWRAVPLHEDWPDGARAWLVAPRQAGSAPILAGHRPGASPTSAGGLDVFRYQGDDSPGWTVQSYELPAEDNPDQLAFIDMEGQLVLVGLGVSGHNLSARLWALRGGETLPVGEMQLDGVSPTAWSIFGFSANAALIAQYMDQADTKPDAKPAARDSADVSDVHASHDHSSAEVELIWTQADIHGKTALKPTAMTIQSREHWEVLASYMRLLLVAVLVTVLMLAFWRRDASWNRLNLPPGVIVADLSRRVLAAMIDLAPGVLGVMVAYRISLESLMLRWPGDRFDIPLDKVLPGILVIAVFVAHTTLSELVFARTLGKRIIGLRTAQLDGTRPRAWQLLTRGLLKILDLLPSTWLLLILPVIGPHRQRLGDLVGRTVVIMDEPQEEQEQEPDDADDQDPDQDGSE